MEAGVRSAGTLAPGIVPFPRLPVRFPLYHADLPPGPQDIYRQLRSPFLGAQTHAPPRQLPHPFFFVFLQLVKGLGGFQLSHFLILGVDLFSPAN